MQQIKKIILSEVVVGEQMTLTLTEFEHTYSIDETLFQEMLEHGLLSLEKPQLENIYVDLNTMRRLQAARRLKRDLEVNMQGIALILDLRDELEAARKELNVLRKHWGDEAE